MVEERSSFSIGESGVLSRVITLEDILAYARISGDMNPVHTDPEYASTTYFGGQIAHGMLVASLISSVLGNQLPGPGAIYLSQELKFKAPVRPGDEVLARVTVVEWDSETGRIGLETEVLNQKGKAVITGLARLIMSSFIK
jgi:acyl dehydratase